MSFTQDELQAFNTILEQKLTIHRRELERTFDQRLQVLRREFESRLQAAQQDLLRALPQRLSEQEYRLKNALTHKIDAQQTRIAQAVLREIEQDQQPFEDSIERVLAAQLLAFEQLINQRLSPSATPIVNYTGEVQEDFTGIEVQTEISWDALTEVIDHALDERLSTLNHSVQTTIKNMEHYLTTQIHALHDDLVHGPTRSFAGTLNSVQDVFTSVEQLERIVESMQVAMNANNALLSNRLYHHQQLPHERAHPSHATATSLSEADAEDTTNQLPQPRQAEDE